MHPRDAPPAEARRSHFLQSQIPGAGRTGGDAPGNPGRVSGAPGNRVGEGHGHQPQPGLFPPPHRAHLYHRQARLRPEQRPAGRCMGYEVGQESETHAPAAVPAGAAPTRHRRHGRPGHPGPVLRQRHHGGGRPPAAPPVHRHGAVPPLLRHGQGARGRLPRRGTPVGGAESAARPDHQGRQRREGAGVGPRRISHPPRHSAEMRSSGGRRDGAVVGAGGGNRPSFRERQQSAETAGRQGYGIQQARQRRSDCALLGGPMGIRRGRPGARRCDTPEKR